MSTNNTSEPWTWCTNCAHHAAATTLCPVCLDDQAHGIAISLAILDETNDIQDGRGTE